MNESPPHESLLELFDWTDPLLKSLFPGFESPWRLVEGLSRALETQAAEPDPLHRLQERYPSAWFDPSGSYWIDPSVAIEPGAYLSGTILARPGASIGHASRLRGPVYLGPGSRVGHGSEIKNSLLLQGSVAAHLNFVGDSVVGEGANLGAGAVCANLRFDGRPIAVHAESGRVSTALRKCGAFIGAGARVGCSATLAPGAVVGRGAWISPNLLVRGRVAPGFHLCNP
jgi:NDP-sugar pyrophosphorylase family protein